MSNHPGLSSARILWVSLPWIPITRDSSPHPAIYLVINLYSSLAHTVPRTESSSILRIFFPLLQVSWLIKICFYHFNYCPTLVFLWHATSPSTKLLLTLAGENELHLLWYLYHIPMTCSFDIFAKNNLVVSLSPKAQILYNETISPLVITHTFFIHPSPKQSLRPRLTHRLLSCASWLWFVLFPSPEEVSNGHYWTGNSTTVSLSLHLRASFSQHGTKNLLKHLIFSHNINFSYNIY